MCVLQGFYFPSAFLLQGSPTWIKKSKEVKVCTQINKLPVPWTFFFFLLTCGHLFLHSLSHKPPQFVDIPLEEDEDSSDEEYCPDEDEEDETAEDVRESLRSSLHGFVCWDSLVESDNLLTLLWISPLQTFQESDVDSTASSPRVSRAGRARTPVEHSEGDEEKHHSPRLVMLTIYKKKITFHVLKQLNTCPFDV